MSGVAVVPGVVKGPAIQPVGKEVGKGPVIQAAGKTALETQARAATKVASAALDKCSICQGPFSYAPKSKLVAFVAHPDGGGHPFHLGCWEEFIRNSSADTVPKCPNCRTIIDTKALEEEEEKEDPGFQVCQPALPLKSPQAVLPAPSTTQKPPKTGPGSTAAPMTLQADPSKDPVKPAELLPATAPPWEEPVKPAKLLPISAPPLPSAAEYLLQAEMAHMEAINAHKPTHPIAAAAAEEFINSLKNGKALGIFKETDQPEIYNSVVRAAARASARIMLRNKYLEERGRENEMVEPDAIIETMFDMFANNRVIARDTLRYSQFVRDVRNALPGFEASMPDARKAGKPAPAAAAPQAARREDVPPPNAVKPMFSRDNVFKVSDSDSDCAMLRALDEEGRVLSQAEENQMFQLAIIHAYDSQFIYQKKEGRVDEDGILDGQLIALAYGLEFYSGETSFLRTVPEWARYKALLRAVDWGYVDVVKVLYGMGGIQKEKYLEAERRAIANYNNIERVEYEYPPLLEFPYETELSSHPSERTYYRGSRAISAARHHRWDIVERIVKIPLSRRLVSSRNSWEIWENHRKVIKCLLENASDRNVDARTRQKILSSLKA